MPGVLLMGGSPLRLGSAVLTMGGVGGGGGGGGSTVPASALAAVPGTLMAWDATVPMNALAWNTGAALNMGAPISQWAGAQVGGIANSIPAQPRLRSVQGQGYSTVNPAGATAIAAAPRARTNGGVAAIGAAPGSLGQPGFVWPGLAIQQLWMTESEVSLPATQPWYVALAYARPHVCLFGRVARLLTYTQAHPGNELLTLDSVLPATPTAAGASTMRVLGQTVKTGIYPSYWGTALLVHTPGQGIRVYLDNSTTAVNPTAPIALPGGWPATGFLAALGIPQQDQGAQCYLHELAVGGPVGGATAISQAQIDAVMATFAARYQTGTAPTILLATVGQSNATLSKGVRNNMRPLLAYLTGALAFDWLAVTGEAPGRALYVPENPKIAISDASYLTMWPGGTAVGDTTPFTDPADFTLGSIGATLVNSDLDPARTDMWKYIHGCLAGIFAYYSEAASVRPHSELAANIGAWRNFANRVRAARTADGIPSDANNLRVLYTELVANEGWAQGGQMVNDAFAALESADGFRKAMPYSVDQSETGAHTNDASYTLAHTRGAYQLSREVLAARGLSPSIVPAGIPGLGPSISAAQWNAGTQSVLVTVQHDTGNDITLPDEVRDKGLGFALRTGWVSPSNRGTLVYATSAVKVSATQFRVFFSTLPATALPAGDNRLFYVEQGINYGAAPQSGTNAGTNRVGAGNAVVDNAASRLPASHPIALDLGPGFAQNMALRWTPAGVPIS